MTLEEARELAQMRAEQYGTTIAHVYTLGDAFVFEATEEFAGVFPLVVDKDGERFGIWEYINEYDLTMDDMKEVEL